MSKLARETKETQVVTSVRVGDGPVRVETDEPFLTHMVETLARYAGLAVDLQAKGDLRHHLIEDVAITLGLALADEVPTNAARYGWALLPMDDALVEAAVDLGGRPWYAGRLPSTLYQHFLRSFAFNLGATLHVKVVRGRDRHHVVEAAVKAVGLSLRQALRSGGAGEAVFSTKGSVRIERTEPTSPRRDGDAAPSPTRAAREENV
jgi:imidazoleglycerol-phosphate dehydratase